MMSWVKNDLGIQPIPLTWGKSYQQRGSKGITAGEESDLSGYCRPGFIIIGAGTFLYLLLLLLLYKLHVYSLFLTFCLFYLTLIYI